MSAYTLVQDFEDDEQGEHVPLPPKPSKRSQVMLAVRAAPAPAPAPAIHADDQPIQFRNSTMSPARITLTMARAGRAGEAELRRMLGEMGIAGRLQGGNATIRPDA